jgi:hypothetical protein
MLQDILDLFVFKVLDSYYSTDLRARLMKVYGRLTLKMALADD